MKLSPYFQELLMMYKAEIEDMSSDSEGKNIMRQRLKEKREQLPFLFDMMASNPEMLACAFHGCFQFSNSLTIEKLLNKAEHQLGSWGDIEKAVMLEPAAQSTLDLVLSQEGGDVLMVKAACLEYVLRGSQSKKASSSLVDHDADDEDLGEGSEDSDADDCGEVHQRFDRDDGDDGMDNDLEEAGADWLAEQGFDRKE